MAGSSGNGFDKMVVILELLKINRVIFDIFGNETQKSLGKRCIRGSGVQDGGCKKGSREEDPNISHRIVFLNCKDFQ